MHRFALAAIALLAACSENPWLDDPYSSGIQPLFEAPSDTLSSPYLVGAQFDVSLHGADVVRTSWTLDSSDATVLSVADTVRRVEDGDATASASVSAVGVGVAELQVVDPAGRVRHAVAVQVAAPTDVRLVPSRRVIDEAYLERTGDDPDNWTVFAGAATEFELQPTLDGTPLAGAGYPTLDAGDDAMVSASELRSNNLHDVLLLTPNSPGDQVLDITFGDGTAFSWTLRVVDAVDALAVDCTESSTETGNGYCSTTATLNDGSEVFGVMPQWTEADAPLDGEGDLLEWLASNVDNPPGVSVTASFGELSADAVRAGTPDTSTVRSSNDISICGVWSPGALWLALPAFGLLGLRRRRSPQD